MSELRALQERFLRRATSFDASDEGDDRGWLRGAHGAEGLAIYARGHAARMTDTLRDAYPKVAALAGDGFDRLAARYFERHPPTSPTLRDVGDALPGFLAEDSATDALAARHPFAPALALLERARNDAFDASNDAPLEPAALAAVPPDAWPSLVVRASPWLRVIRLEWAAHRAWRALEDEVPLPSIAREPTHVVVWRRELRVRHAAVDARDASALLCVLRGATLAEVFAAYAGDGGPERAAASALEALLGWFADGHIASIAAAPMP